ncbi:PDZ domain-containing protein [Candidatus Enterovibrio escicola]|uniref:PDZ domain-containing protein n=1 Tax=Candidatus Enterovibrio escicola TaxID=1927127 RepID=UPI0012381463|nr:PDZ domain-containing protein [Candidatus Enterovibrio escacola]
MNIKLIPLLPLLTIPLITTVSAKEQESNCAYISTNFHSPSGKWHTIELTGHNGKYFPKPKRKIALAPGLHNFTAQRTVGISTSRPKHYTTTFRGLDNNPHNTSLKYPSKHNEQVDKIKNRPLPSTSRHNKADKKNTEINFQIKVSPNKQYRLLTIARENKQNPMSYHYEVKIRSEKNRQCSNDEVFLALDMQTPINATDKLPAHIQKKLELLSHDIYTYLNSEQSSIDNSNLKVPPHITQNLGLLLEPTNITQLRVKLVLPNSLAQQLGLKKGDVINEISQFNLQKNSSYVESLLVFKEQIFNHQEGKELVIKVLRDGQLETLKSMPPTMKIPTTILVIG